MVVIVLSPFAVQFFDSYFHTHHHHHHHFQNSEEFVKYHKKCPIAGFEYSFFSTSKIFINNFLVVFVLDFKIDISDGNCCKQLLLPFSLRAPPVLLK
ncbi:MAG: hypothetical protein C0596_15180 [Marinilabiliales bacterium]|nr:MAG: hypothetical protein C0596_15180 [Marinilabiliales bacterium]